jgi:exodeoxyribonuclease VII small subunit
MTKKTQSYSEMLNQVETIITKMNQSELDLDELVENIEQGYGLLGQMRQRLTDTKMKVENLYKTHTEDNSQNAE